MTQDMNELERDIEQSRARLDLTIDRLQDKLSVSGVVDDVLGAMRANSYGDSYDRALLVLRRNPVPVMLVAAGVGWLLYRMGNESVRRRRLERRVAVARLGPEGTEYEPDVPAVSTGQSRVYDPDTSPLRPTHDTLDSRREFNARA